MRNRFPPVVTDDIYRLPRDGRDGLPGRDGLDGRPGVQGPAGANGQDGRSLIPAGYWNPKETYSRGEVVEYLGSSYVAKRETRGSRPGALSPEDWQQLAAQGERGERGEQGSPGPRGRGSAIEGSGGLVPINFGTMPSPGAPIYVDGSGLGHPASASDLSTSKVVGFREGTQLRIDGLLTQQDWSLVAGTPLLTPGAMYFLGVTPGTISTESGSPIVVPLGVAISGVALSINVQSLTMLSV
jgi:hypothetical protein